MGSQENRPRKQRDRSDYATAKRVVKITVVDDDSEIRDWLQQTLSGEGFLVNAVPDGLRFLESLVSDRPDLIVLDVVMSWMDGFDLCRALKQNPRFADIPIVFLSGRTDPRDRERGLACGAVDYFPKPIASTELIHRVKQLVHMPV